MHSAPDDEERRGIAKSDHNQLSIAQAIEITIAPRLAEVHRCIAEVLKPAADSVEAVHDLRVSLRRAIAALVFFRGIINKRFRRKTIKHLKQVCRKAGRARDLDVTIERLRVKPSKAALLFLDSIQGERAALQVSFGKHLREIDSRMQSLARDNLMVPLKGAPNCDLTDLFKPWAQRRVARNAKRFLRSSRHTRRTAESLHCLRISGKKLRYALEILTPVVPDVSSSAAYRRLRELQRLLGEVNDSVLWLKTIKAYRRVSHQVCIHRFVKRQARKGLRQRTAYFAELKDLWSEKKQSEFTSDLNSLLQEDSSC